MAHTPEEFHPTPEESSKVEPTCPMDGEPDSMTHNLLKANTDILAAMRSYTGQAGRSQGGRREATLPMPVHGALLHALDELEALAEKLNIEGFQHYDH